MIELFKNKIIKLFGGCLITEGLVENINYEIKVKIGSFELNDYLYILKYLIDYIIEGNAIIKENQTVSFNSWVFKLVLAEKNVLEIYEFDKSCTAFVIGADFSLNILQSQMTMCNKYSSKFLFPRINQKIVISDGIRDEYPIEGVRYESPEHMSGWWLTSNLYDGNIVSLKQIELHELILMRPELIKYLALDNGFRFILDKNGEDVWFDKDIN